MIKMIATDIDGTLANSESKLNPRTRDRLIEAQKQGIKLVIASGRPAFSMQRYVDELEMAKYGGLIVSFNGAQINDCSTGETLYQKTISLDETRQVIEHVQNYDVIPTVTIGKYMYVNKDNVNRIYMKSLGMDIVDYEVVTGDLVQKVVDDLPESITQPVNKILVAGVPSYLQEHYKELSAPFSDLNAVFTADHYYEFNRKNVDKATALEYILPKLGYSKDDLVAFGDGQNDMTMLQYASTGVAMENANDEVKNIADQVTLTNDKDGIAEFLDNNL
ncbi:Cof-type HAD-IIB family hydrolase [Lactobacillus terrae]|uniref:Cof-type HAD-IIB family hydrolase n=1 Tax=Lactobacillus terrae TaxID=2269374 RepID=UPI000C1B6968|nr:Cof-type HAD-IIB family hydrolase [Lactobacillus terrae]